VAINVVGSSVASAASTAVTPVSACGSITTVLDYDNNSYNTVSIGTQCWTKENLKVTKYNDGTLIPDETANTSWPSLVAGARSEYVAPGVTGYVSTYGYLYNWFAVNDSRKLCPAGWHVPTDAEWTIMIQTLDPMQVVTSGVQSATAGTLMKKNDALWITDTGTNTSGFSGLPAGQRNSVGAFVAIRNSTNFWSATGGDGITDSPFGAKYRYLFDSNSTVIRGSDNKQYGYSVRCLRDI
jgi:uncharacterized protein (TIGR02145 family)